MDASICIGKRQDAVLQIFRRNHALHSGGAGIDTALVVQEVEDAIFLNTSAKRSSKLIPIERRDTDATAVIEPPVRCGDCIAVVSVGRSMQLIGSTLGHQHYLTSG